MKVKIILPIFCIILISIFTGGYFVYKTLSNETIVDSDTIQESDKLLMYPKMAQKGKPATSSHDSSTEKAPNTKSQNETKSSSQNNDQVVVDQTRPVAIAHEEDPGKTKDSLGSSKEKSVKENNSSIDKNVLGSIKEKINVEITLYDAEQNKYLTDYDVEFKYKNNMDPEKTEKYSTDKNGKFVFTTTQLGFINMQISTKDYASHSKYLNVHYGNNEYVAKLYKGGSIEVRATSPENKTIEGLTVRYGGAQALQSQGSLMFDAAKGLYVISNMPLGTQNVYFKAPGFLESLSYMIRVDAKNNFFLEVKLLPTRMLYFDLNIAEKPESISISRKSVLKNKDNLYEYEIDFRYAPPSLSVSVKNYASQVVKIVPEIDTYKVILEEGKTGKIQVNDENGNAIKGANVVCSQGATGGAGGKSFTIDGNGMNLSGTKIMGGATDNFFNQVVTGEDGLAVFTGLSEIMQINVTVTHKNYLEYSETWAFDSKDAKIKTIVLVDSNGVSGKVKFGDKVVMGALVTLVPVVDDVQFRGRWSKPINWITESDGSYRFSSSKDKKDKEYTINAFHRDFGYAVSATFKFDDTAQVIDLNLVAEKSLNIKLVDGAGVVLPNKTITLTLTNGNMTNVSMANGNIMVGNGNSTAVSIKTNEKGEYDFVNLEHGTYIISLEDDKLVVKDKNIQIPTGTVVLTAEKKYLKKILVTTQGGGAFKGLLEAKVSRTLAPLNIIMGEDGNYYLVFLSENQVINGAILFEAQGFAITATVNYNNVKSVPDEIIVELVEGEIFLVKVVDDKSYFPMTFVKVDLLMGDSIIQSLPTNEIGEILFTHLSGKFNVAVRVEKYVAYKIEIDISKTKDVTVKLIKGGTLKGHITIDKNVTKSCYISLQPRTNYYAQVLDANGNFEIVNIQPGEYTLTYSLYSMDNKITNTTVPTKIIIKNEEFFEINLDDVLKKKDL